MEPKMPSVLARTLRAFNLKFNPLSVIVLAVNVDKDKALEKTKIALINDPLKVVRQVCVIETSDPYEAAGIADYVSMWAREEWVYRLTYEDGNYTVTKYNDVHDIDEEEIGDSIIEWCRRRAIIVYPLASFTDKEIELLKEVCDCLIEVE